MNEQSTYISCFFFFLFYFLLLFCSCFLFFFFFFFSSSTLPSSFLSFFSFFLFASVCSSVCCSFVLVFFFCFVFLLLSIPAFFSVLFVDVVLWCLKLQFTVTRFILSPCRTHLAQAPNRDMLYSHLHHH